MDLQKTEVGNKMSKEDKGITCQPILSHIKDPKHAVFLVSNFELLIRDS